MVHYRVDGGGHTWPGGPPDLPVRMIDSIATYFDATVVLLALAAGEQRTPWGQRLAGPRADPDSSAIRAFVLPILRIDHYAYRLLILIRRRAGHPGRSPPSPSSRSEQGSPGPRCHPVEIAVHRRAITGFLSWLICVILWLVASSQARKKPAAGGYGPAPGLPAVRVRIPTGARRVGRRPTAVRLPPGLRRTAPRSGRYRAGHRPRVRAGLAPRSRRPAPVPVLGRVARDRARGATTAGRHRPPDTVTPPARSRVGRCGRSAPRRRFALRLPCLCARPRSRSRAGHVPRAMATRSPNDTLRARRRSATVRFPSGTRRRSPRGWMRKSSGVASSSASPSTPAKAVPDGTGPRRCWW